MPKMPILNKVSNQPIKRLDELPEILKPYRWFGLDFNYKENKKEITTQCPWCESPKFSIKAVSGMWQCFACQEGSKKGGGNIYTFLNVLLKHSLSSTTKRDYEQLCEERGLLDWESLREWNAAKSIITQEWILPGYNVEGKLATLYRYMELGGKKVVLPAPGLGTHLYGYHLYDDTKPITNVCEGFWDSVALYESLKLAKRGPNGRLFPTNSSSGSLLESHNVIGFPGTKVYFDAWNPLFKDKCVNIFFDNDYPKETKVGTIVQAGFQGTKKLSSVLFQIDDGPSEVNHLCWGEEGYSKDYPNKYDVRDMLNTGKQPPEVQATLRFVKLKRLFNMVEPSPLEWADEAFHVEKSDPVLPPIYCDRYEDVLEALKVAFDVSRSMDIALSAMYAVIASTLAVGDQLWLKVFGPPGSGKSTICEGLSLNKTYTVAKSSIRGFYSGFAQGETALISEASGKTLITKEFDALINSGNMGQILSEARDLYDGAGRPSYRNQASRDYNAVRMTWIIAGVASMRQLDKSELGARFLDVIMVEGVTLDREFEMSVKASMRAINEVKQTVDGSNKMDTPEMRTAKQLMAGYIDYLRKNASEMLSRIEGNERVYQRCACYGMFTAFMRARPSEYNEEDEDEKELSMRLTKQFSRMAACLTFVLNRSEIDPEVMRRVRKICLDTSRGKVFRLTKQLFKTGGMPTTRCVKYMGVGDAEGERILEYMRNIGAFELKPKRLKSGGFSESQFEWTMTPFLQKLYRAVLFDK